MYKPPKNFDTPEPEQPFRFIYFEEFPWVCCSWWGNRTYWLPCVLFGHEYVGKCSQKNESKLANCSKNIQKTSKYSNGKIQKEGNIVSWILMWIHIASNPPPFLKRKTKIPKNWVGGMYITASGNILVSENLCFRVFKL